MYPAKHLSITGNVGVVPFAFAAALPVGVPVAGGAAGVMVSPRLSLGYNVALARNSMTAGDAFDLRLSAGWRPMYVFGGAAVLTPRGGDAC